MKKLLTILLLLMLGTITSYGQEFWNIQEDGRDTVILSCEVEENRTVVTYEVTYPCWYWTGEFRSTLVQDNCVDRFQLHYPHDKGRFKRPVQHFIGEIYLDTIMVPKTVERWRYRELKDVKAQTDSILILDDYLWHGDTIKIDTIKN